MKNMIARITMVVTLSALLAGCNLRPLYAGGTTGVVAQELGHVEIEPIAGKAGWLMRNALKDQLDAFEGQQAKYRLTVALEDKISGFGVRSDDRITRERRTLRARYQLVRLADSVVVLDATAGSDAGIDVVSSEYATLAAEDTALENLATRVSNQIVTRLSLFAREEANASPQP
ncbi:LPS assembly lipoprotein LptE [uncultured Parasphingorhabdus sp.]|uniref:LPS assembly lipoprotein LptE n=1 Tax=uncultured Parasphingorhabdus sp. TaxID=2709694 RepID=UPI0030D90414|tara:strand:+ start:2034 stop:2555 length:522 start_codon:yes stop_codon:yes gene_type:complete